MRGWSLFNPALADFIADYAQHLDYVAVIPDRFSIDRGLGADPRFEDTSAGEALLAQAAPRLPIVMHGIGLSICSADVFDREYLIQLERWRARYDCRWVSEHLSFSRIGAGHETNAGIALPVPFNSSILDMLRPRIENARSILGCPFLLENNVSYFTFPDEDLTDRNSSTSSRGRRAARCSSTCTTSTRTRAITGSTRGCSCPNWTCHVLVKSTWRAAAR